VRNLDEGRRILLACPQDGLADPPLDFEHVFGDEPVALDPVAERLQRHVFDRHRPRKGGAHRVLVVLADEDDGQLPQRREADPFVKAADAHRAFAEKAERDPAVAPVLAGERDARGQRDVAAHDAVAAEHVVLASNMCIDPPRPFEQPVALPKSSAKKSARSHSLGQGDAVVAVRGDDVVVGPKSGDRTDRHGLLSDVEMQKPADFALRVPARALLLDPANQEHVAVQFCEVFQLLFGARLRGRRAGFGHQGCGIVGLHRRSAESNAPAPQVTRTHSPPGPHSPPGLDDGSGGSAGPGDASRRTCAAGKGAADAGDRAWRVAA
jgi:hypothetical protein